MFQPEVKLAFVKRYCPPENGWEVFVDIDASEKGKTGGLRKHEDAKQRQDAMQLRGREAEERLKELGVQVGGAREEWQRRIWKKHGGNKIPTVPGDRDIVAIHPGLKTIRIAEAEGESSVQPEQKLYKAIGQAVIAKGCVEPGDWKVSVIIVVHGEAMGAHMEKAAVLAGIGIAGLVISKDVRQDRWLFGTPLTPYV